MMNLRRRKYSRRRNRRRIEIARRLGIGFSPEDSEVFVRLTIEQNIELPTWIPSNSKSASERIDNAYRVIPKLRKYPHRESSELSGEREPKMVSIAAP
jgi:branched-chain amino acid transport system ATP-binding protein